MSAQAPSRLTPQDLDQHRRELHLHCYRMLASFDDAEDATQEALTRAWNARATLKPDSNLRAWLYKIATNVCIDEIRRTQRHLISLDRSFSEVPWLQPYPDSMLDPHVQRETVELAFLALIQLLPPRQRAVLLLRDVLGFSAAESAELLEMSVASVTSALQRARQTISERPAGEQPIATPSPYEQELLAKFIDAHERGDWQASLEITREDMRVTMPPLPAFYRGLDDFRGLWVIARGEEGGRGNGMGEWKLVKTGVNRMPTAASYLRAPGQDLFRAVKLDVLRIEGDKIAEATTFPPDLFPALGLGMTLEPEG
jgi:RNA polymerase sigma-70 factor (TIGR02960 family)